MCVTLLLMPLTFGAAPPLDLEAARRKAVAQMSPEFERRVVIFKKKESVPPRGRIDVEPLFEAKWNPSKLFRFFIGDEKPDVYLGHLVQGVIGDRPHLYRFDSLFYRLGETIPDDRKFGDDHAALAKAMGLNADVVKRNAELVKRVLRNRTFGEWSRDPQAARLMAGLYLSKPAKGAANKWDDAFALERQRWVDRKRGIASRDEKLETKPFVCPLPIKGKGYPEVHEGTEAEAGVKPGTAAKLHEALVAFEKDTDEAFAVCVVRKGVIVLHAAYGKRNGKPMTVDTPSWMASVTKTMSASLMLMLISQGKVKPDDPVSKFLPCLRGIKQKKPLTIEHLYTHTNGLTLDGYPGWNDEMPDVAERVAAYYDRLKVGEKWAYTGTGNILGGKVIEMVAGEAIPQFYHKHLLSPLGMTNTHVTDTHAGAFSIPLDVAKFGQMLLNRGAYGKYRFFDEKTFTDVMLPRKLTRLLGDETKKTFGFGLDGSAERFGLGAASAATFHVDVKRQLVVVMTRNRQGKNQDKHQGAFWKALDEGIAKE